MKKVGIVILIVAIILIVKSFVFGVVNFVGDVKDGVVSVVENFLSDEDEGSNEDQDMEALGNASYENYKSIKLGDSYDSVKSNIGEPTSIEYSEYDFNWYVYAGDYSRFFMVGVYNNKVVALFSNTMNSCETDIDLNSTKSQVNKRYTPLESRTVANVSYVSKETHFEVFENDKKFTTVFYDLLDGDKVKGVQIVSEAMEKQMKSIYPTDKNSIKSLENINIYVLNAERFQRGLNILKYDETAAKCAKSHSEDMRDNTFFGHKNLKGQTPFDRMEQFGIDYKAAAENLAAGQTSSIFAHYGLLNSEGHRVNMLGEYDNIGVGVALGGKMKFYITQNFFR